MNATVDKPLTQCEEILRYIRENGSITALNATTELLIMNFTARISDLRAQGYDVQTETVTKRNKYKRLVSFKRYWIGGTVR